MSGAEYQIADQIVDIGDLLKWVGHARVEIARLRAQLRTADTRTQAALDDRADAEARGRRKGAAACLADVAQLETEAIQDNSRVAGVASNLANAYMLLGNTALINKELERYLALTPADLQRAAQQYFSLDNRVVLHYVPINPKK